MGTTERVAFRYYENQPPQWEAYGIDSAAYGSGGHIGRGASGHQKRYLPAPPKCAKGAPAFKRGEELAR